METPVTVMDSKKWSFMVIMVVMPMKPPLAHVVIQGRSLFMMGRVLEEVVGDCGIGMRPFAQGLAGRPFSVNSSCSIEARLNMIRCRCNVLVKIVASLCDRRVDFLNVLRTLRTWDKR